MTTVTLTQESLPVIESPPPVEQSLPAMESPSEEQLPPPVDLNSLLNTTLDVGAIAPLPELTQPESAPGTVTILPPTSVSTIVNLLIANLMPQNIQPTAPSDPDLLNVLADVRAAFLERLGSLLTP